ncbi:MAG: hypothetical protein CM1200mP2_56820 [Planctomycetaceae bacterium]|nr:MAG: hypothetical protein CM1200mP2_56820 [Planctomycetaceae bacterium]
MTELKIDYRDCDRVIWDEEFADFVPDRVLDAHIHCYWHSNHSDPDPVGVPRGHPRDAQLVGRGPLSRSEHAVPDPGNSLRRHRRAKHVESVRQEIGDPRNSTQPPGHALVPTRDIERDMQNPQFVGLKPYRTYSVTGDIAQCRIHEFLPHEQLELANQHGWWVTMHLSRLTAVPTPTTSRSRGFTTPRVPQRSLDPGPLCTQFHLWPIKHAIERLRDMPNIHYDTSAVTDVRPYVTLLTGEDPAAFSGGPTVWGGVLPRPLPGLGRAWQHFDADVAGLQFPHCDGRPILSVYEQLMSLKLQPKRPNSHGTRSKGSSGGTRAPALGIGEDEGWANSP